MNIKTEMNAMFDVPDGHTPKVLLAGGTEQDKFTRVWQEIPEDKLKDMDTNSSRLHLPVHPVFVLIYIGEDAHVHASISLPLQDLQEELHIEESILETKDLKRITDWVAGFMEAFCMNDTVTAIDLVTEQPIIGGKNPAFSMQGLMKDIRPPKDMRLESIGDVDDILNGQLNAKEIEEIRHPSPEGLLKKAKAVEMKSIPVVEEDPNILLKKQQQEVVDKYGWKALEEMTKKMKQPILIEKP